MNTSTITGAIVGTIVILGSLLYLNGCESLGFVSKEQTASLKQTVGTAEDAKIAASARAGKAETAAAGAQRNADTARAKRKAIGAEMAGQYQRLADAGDEDREAIDGAIEALKIRMEAAKVAEDKANQSLAAALSVQEDAAEEIAALDAVIAKADAEIEALAEQQKEAIAKIPALVSTVGGAVGSFVPGAGAVADQASQGLGSIIGILAGGSVGIGGLLAARKKAREADAEAKKAGALGRAIAITEQFGFDRITQDPTARAAARAAMAQDPDVLKEYTLAKLPAKQAAASVIPAAAA